MKRMEDRVSNLHPSIHVISRPHKPWEGSSVPQSLSTQNTLLRSRWEPFCFFFSCSWHPVYVFELGGWSVRLHSLRLFYVGFWNDFFIFISNSHDESGSFQKWMTRRGAVNSFPFLEWKDGPLRSDQNRPDSLFFSGLEPSCGSSY